MTWPSRMTAWRNMTWPPGSRPARWSMRNRSRARRCRGSAPSVNRETGQGHTAVGGEPLGLFLESGADGLREPGPRLHGQAQALARGAGAPQGQDVAVGDDGAGPADDGPQGLASLFIRHQHRAVPELEVRVVGAEEAERLRRLRIRG